MKKTLIGAAAVALGLTGALAFVGMAQATETSSNPCNVEGFYVNPDEKPNPEATPPFAGYEPERTYKGFVFEGKDLIHHTTSLDFPDVKLNTLSFKATVDGKVQGKMETSNPYSTINQNLDGKFWSTAMTYDQVGGQGNPVANVSDLLGKDVKPGKVKFGENSKVISFGVGYITDEGETTVTSITFHGTKYGFTCEEPTATPTATPTESTSPTPTATPTESHTTPPTGGNGSQSPTTKPTPTKSQTAAPVTPSESESTPAQAGLPVTGPGGGTNVPLISGLAGGALLAFGIALFAWAKRRRDNDAVEFTA